MSEPIVTTVYDHGDDPKDVSLCRAINKMLHDHYPGWAWSVDIPPEQNLVIVRNLTCDPYGKMGMSIHKDKLDVNLRSVVMAGGEFLERYRMRRGKFTPDQTEGRVMHTERADDDPRKRKKPIGW